MAAKRIRGRNEGSISPRQNGTFRAQVTAYGRRLSATFKTKADAQKWIHDQAVKLDRGYDFQRGKIPLREYLPQWLETSQAQLRPKTALHYSQVIRKHILPYLGGIALKDLHLAQVEWFYGELLQRKVGPRTVRICHNILHKALEKAQRYSLINYNPAHGAALPQYKHAEMQVLDDTQVSQLLLAASTSPYQAYIHLAVTTGMRQGELFGLKWSDIQWGRGVIHVQRQVQTVPGKGWEFEESKTRAGRRTIKLGEGTLQVLREHRERLGEIRQKSGVGWQEYDLVFPSKVGTPGNPSNMRLEFNRMLTLAGLPKIRFHDLRHTAASLLLNHRVPVIVVSKMLGHSKPSITLDIYGHLYHEMQEEAAEIMDSLVTPIKIQIPLDAEANSR